MAQYKQVVVNSGLGPKSSPHRIDLFVPYDQDVAFVESGASTITPSETSLNLVGYNGKLGIPRSTSLDLSLNSANVIGTLASPALIDGTGNINILLDSNSDLELMVNTEGTLFVGGKLVEGKKSYGGKFATVRNDFLQGKSNELKKPRLKHTQEGVRAIYTQAEMQPYSDVDICREKNIVYIRTGSGVVSVYWAKIPDSPLSELEKLERKLDNAVKEENFEQAAAIRTKLDKIKQEKS
jgi:hypothetical protein